MKHYKLYYDGQHYVRDKKFDSLAALVADGLLIMHMECEAGPYIALMSDAVRCIQTCFILMYKLITKPEIQKKL